MDLVVLVAAAAFAGPLVRVAPLVTIAACCVLFGLSTIGARARARAARTTCFVGAVIAAAAFAASAARAQATIEASERAFGSLSQTLPQPTRCEVEGCVVASPTRRGGAFRVVVEVASARCGDEPPSSLAPVAGFRAALSTEVDDLARGDTIRGLVQLAPVERFWNPELGDPAIRTARIGISRSGGALSIERVARGHGVGAWIDRARAHVRRRIDATFAPLASPMARALVLGESDLDAGDDLAFRTSGLSHLLAVSGMHLVLVVLTFERVLAFMMRRVERCASAFDVGRVAAGAAIPCAWLYADFAGGSGSAVRAAWMLTVLLAAKMGGRRSTGTRALGVSTMAAVLCDPLAVFDVSFVLSLAATAGLLAFSTTFGEYFAPSERGPPAVTVVAKSVATTLAATLPCAPLLAQLGPSIPLGGLFANVIAVPLGEIAALPLCLLHALLAPFPDVERGSAVAASGALLAVRVVARFCASTTWASLPVPPPTAAQLGAMLVALGAFALPHVPRRLVMAVAMACCVVVFGDELRVRSEGAPRGLLRVTMLDVAQGDSILVDLPDGQAVLIDAGGLVGSPIDVGSRVVAPVLRARRRSEIAIVMLSHPHPDHYGGMASATERVRVRELWDTGQGEAEESEGARGAQRAIEARGARIRRPDTLCGSHQFGGATIEVLAPCPRFDADHGPNDNSLVVRIRYGRRAFLFVGDAERHEEADLLRRYGASPGNGLRADVLKVGHHGSATSTTPPFVDAIRPQVAILSCGARNRFGHPRAETLATLARYGIFTARTDRDGGITVETDGEALSVRTARGGQRVLYTARDR